MTSQPSAALVAAAKRDAQPPSEDRLEAIRNELRRSRDLKKEVADLEERLKGKKLQLLLIEQRTLPDMFTEVNIDVLGLPAEGNLPAYDASLTPYYHANIATDWPEERQAAAFEWLDDKGHGDIIKSIVTVELGRDESKARKRLLAALDKLGTPYSVKLGVPWNTLTAFVKEQIEKHKTTPPLEMLGATVGKVVKLKERKA